MLRSLLKSVFAGGARKQAPAAATELVERGLAAQSAGRLAEAERCYRLALDAHPHDAHVLQLLGVSLVGCGRAEEAIVYLNRALRTETDRGATHYHLGGALRVANRLDDAVIEYHRIGPQDPMFAPAQLQIGNVCRERGLPLQARDAYRAAVDAAPQLSEAWHNLGSVESDLNLYLDAIGSFDRALALAPHLLEARLSRTLARLALGELGEGWEAYEVRHRIPRLTHNGRAFALERWSGEPLADRTLLVWGEQGIAEEILFAGMYPQLLSRVENVLLECSAKLVPLFRRSFPTAQVVPRSDPPHSDCTQKASAHIAAGSLARWFRRTLEQFPKHAGYLAADAAKVLQWRKRLGALGSGPKIGFSWRSTANKTGARGLSFTRLQDWDALLRVTGVHWICLQYNDCETELTEARARLGVELHRYPEVDYFDDLDEVSALTSALDLVITVRTAVCFEAAALGVETWQVLYGSDWQTHGTGENPWLPAIRRFPRTASTSWEQLFAEVALRLREWLSDPASRRPRPEKTASHPAVRGHAEWVPGEEMRRISATETVDCLPPAPIDALCLLNAGHVDAACETMEAVVAASPTDADAWELLGTVATKAGKHSRAYEAFERATAFVPDSAAAWVGLANASRALSLREACAHAFRRACELRADVPELHFNLGLVYEETSALEEAEACYRRAIALQPLLAPAHLHLGLLLLRTEGAAVAEPHLRRALELAPRSVPAMLHRGRALQELGRLDEAEATYRAAVQLAPRQWDLHYNHGQALLMLGRLEEAQAALERASERAPDRAECAVALAETMRRKAAHADAVRYYESALEHLAGDADLHYRLGVAYFLCERLDEALQQHRIAVAASPEHHEAHIALNRTLHELGRHNEAIAGYEAMIARDPEDGWAHWNLSHALLSSGQLERGYEEYEWRFHHDVRVARRRMLPLPVWKGEPLDGKGIVVHAEQGIGDQILFASMFPDLIERGAMCRIECAPKLVSLFSRAFPSSEIAAKDDPAPAWPGGENAFQVAAGSLARLLRPSVAAMRPAAAFLRPDSGRAQYWRERFNRLGERPKIGICWRSHDRSGERILASSPLAAWHAVVSQPDAAFVCLQYDDCETELAEVDGCRILRFPEVDMFDDLDETAALISALDLVISAPTTVSVLAAALGVPSWQLSHGADWQMLGHSGHPWFASLTRFTRQWAEPWQAMLQAVAARLRNGVTAP